MADLWKSTSHRLVRYALRDREAKGQCVDKPTAKLPWEIEAGEKCPKRNGLAMPALSHSSIWTELT